MYKLLDLYMCFVLGGGTHRRTLQFKKELKKYNKNKIIIVNLSGRGDKDIETILNIGGNNYGKI